VNWEDLIAALDEAPGGERRREFVRWVEGRFFEESKAGRRFTLVDGSGAGATVVPEFSGGGWVRWEVSRSWADPLAGLWADTAYIRMVRVEENDRSAATRGPAVAFPLQVLFGPPPG
jgi:hypothetical protein